MIGGLGSAVAEVLAESDFGTPKRFKRIGIPDVFPDQYGSQDSLMGAIRARGCGPVSVWTSQTGGGSLIGMIVGAPSAVNRDWTAQFPDGKLAPSSPLIVVCGSSGGGGPSQVAAQPAGNPDRGAGPPGPAGNE